MVNLAELEVGLELLGMNSLGGLYRYRVVRITKTTATLEDMDDPKRQSVVRNKQLYSMHRVDSEYGKKLLLDRHYDEAIYRVKQLLCFVPKSEEGIAQLKGIAETLKKLNSQAKGGTNG